MVKFITGKDTTTEDENGARPPIGDKPYPQQWAYVILKATSGLSLVCGGGGCALLILCDWHVIVNLGGGSWVMGGGARFVVCGVGGERMCVCMGANIEKDIDFVC